MFDKNINFKTNNSGESLDCSRIFCLQNSFKVRKLRIKKKCKLYYNEPFFMSFSLGLSC